MSAPAINAGPRLVQSRTAAILSFGLIALLLCVFLIANAGPVYFFDSAGIMNAGIQALKAGGLLHVDPATGQIPGTSAAFARHAQDGYVVAGRSAYLGVLMFGAGSVLGAGGYALLQALLTAALLVITLDRFGWGQGITRVRLVLALVVATPLSFFTAVLLADHLFSLMILSVALIAVEESARRTALLGAVVALALLAHYGALMLLILIGPAALILRRLSGRPMRAAALVLAGAAAIGLIGQLLFVAAVEHRMGRPPVTIPTVLARLVEDGPASAVLRQTCRRDPNRWFTCRFATRLPMTEEQFLWTTDPRTGAYGTLPPPLKARISAEERAIVTAAVRAYPLQTIRSSIAHAAEQLVLVDIRDFAVANDALGQQMPTVPNPYARDDYRSLVDTAPHWAALASNLYLLVFLLSVAGALVALVARRRDLPRANRDFAAVILLSFLASAALHATVVGPYPRYQARLAWLATLAAAVVIARRERRFAAPRPPRSDTPLRAPAP